MVSEGDCLLFHVAAKYCVRSRIEGLLENVSYFKHQKFLSMLTSKLAVDFRPRKGVSFCANTCGSNLR